MVRNLSKYMLVFVVAIWISTMVYVMQGGQMASTSIDSTFKMMEELEKQNIQLQQLSKQMSKISISDIDFSSNYTDEILKRTLNKCVEENKNLTQKLKSVLNGGETENTGPTLEREQYLRSIFDNIEETWYYSSNQINKLPGITDEIKKQILREMREHNNAALVEVELLREKDDEWRRKEAQDLQNIVQKRIQYVQNPPDCKKAKKLLCNINKGCGFGCQVHHVTFCFLIAFGTERTLILNSANWRYSKRGWESVFLPLSETCVDGGGGKAAKWSDEAHTKDVQVVSVGIVDSMPKRPPYLPLTIPRDLSDRIMRLHGNPPVWWLSQFIRYLMRMQPKVEEDVENFKKKIEFQSPVVGIHIRRTDKVGSEAALHKLPEYMEHVESWFQRENLKRQRLNLTRIKQPTVYIATDDGNVFAEAKKSYPDYKFLNDPKIVQSASVGKRYSEAGLIGVVMDIILLSECDYIVGTFSSQVSRMAYELMQTRHADASTFAHSLDDVFYFGGQGGHNERVIYENKNKDETLEMDVGDIIGIAGNHWDGFSKGKLLKNNAVGLYPSFKTRDVINLVDFPLLPEAEKVKLKHEFIIR